MLMLYYFASVAVPPPIQVASIDAIQPALPIKLLVIQINAHDRIWTNRRPIRKESGGVYNRAPPIN